MLPKTPAFPAILLLTALGLRAEAPALAVEPSVDPAVVTDLSVPAPPTDTVPADTVAADTVAPAAPAVEAAEAEDTASGRKRRDRIVRETTVNTLDDVKGRYRSPKQALFMSLVVPGLGQAYVGHSAFNYARAVAYLGADVALGFLWYHYTVVKHDRKVKQYRAFADTTWSQGKYEDTMRVISAPYTPDQFKELNVFRETYCDAVQEKVSTSGNNLHKGCLDPKSAGYEDFARVHNDRGPDWSPDSVAAWRSKFPRVFDFYELIGKEQEFIAGWIDAENVSYRLAGDSILITGTSAYRDTYIDMRATANRYARMQAWFLGGMVVNHIVSALDAALAARQHNKALYQTENTGKTGWLDRLRLDGGLAFDGIWPRTHAAAVLTF